MSLLHRPAYHLLHLKNDEKIVASFLLRDLGAGMVDMFVPIILLIGGNTLEFTVLFMLLTSVIRVLAQLLMPPIVRRLGIQHILAYSNILLMAFVLLLNSIDNSTIILFACAAVYGFMNTFYWDARNIDAAHITRGKDSLKKVSLLSTASQFIAVVAPFIGGALGEYISTSAMLMVAFVMLLLSSIVLHSHLMRESKVTYHRVAPYSSVLSKQDMRSYIANFANNFNAYASMFVWALFIYISLENLSIVGGIISVNAIFIVILFYVAGKVKNHRQLFFAGMAVRAASFVARIFAFTPLRIVFADFLGATGWGLFAVTFSDYYLEDARKSKDTTAHVLLKELFGDVSKVCVWGVFLLFLQYDVYAAFVAVFTLSIPMVFLSGINANRTTQS